MLLLPFANGLSSSSQVIFISKKKKIPKYLTPFQNTGEPLIFHNMPVNLLGT